jgi:hypothetical protein
MTRQFQHPAPWSSLDDAGAGERPTPLINTIIVRDDAQAQYPKQACSGWPTDAGRDSVV